MPLRPSLLAAQRLGVTGVELAAQGDLAPQTLTQSGRREVRHHLRSHNLELKSESYRDAAYYKFSIYPEETTVTSPYVNERVEATSFGVALQKATYRWQVSAYNSDDKKLSESNEDIKFTITDGPAAADGAAR